MWPLKQKLILTRKIEFYFLALFIGLVQGGIQSLSRSYYTRLIPLNKSAEFFGFYNMLGKFTAILGPTLMAVVGLGVKHLLMPDAPSAGQIATTSLLATRFSIASLLLPYCFFLSQEPFACFLSMRKKAKKRRLIL
jgi:MFS transporter, UMF1 family